MHLEVIQDQALSLGCMQAQREIEQILDLNIASATGTP